MSTLLDLKSLERKTFRSVHQDGLRDVYIGGVLLCMSLLATSNTNSNNLLLRIGLCLAGIGLFYLIFWGGKKYLTLPRLGQVKFGPQRQKRKMTMIIILTGIVLLQVIILVGTLYLWTNPGWLAFLRSSPSDLDRERLLVATIGALFVGPSTVLIAYFNEFLRGYYIAFILSLAIFAYVWFSQPIYLVAAALLIMLPGIFLFIRFLRQHPLLSTESNHD
jgi:hypothetical protein